MKLSVEGSEATDVITLDETTEGESERSLNDQSESEVHKIANEIVNEVIETQTDLAQLSRENRELRERLESMRK